jgi:hypothetical protein
MDKNRAYRIVFAIVYPLFIKKAESKGRTKVVVAEIIFWLTGYNKQTSMPKFSGWCMGCMG